MLEPVAVHRTGFRAPGLFQDSRGIVVGTDAAAIVYSQEQLSTFLRIVSEDASFPDLLPTLRCEEIRGTFGARAYWVTFRCSDSRTLDSCSRAAAYCMGTLCVGAERHFVSYRDAQAPLGYDVVSLHADREGDYVVYTPHSVLPYGRVAGLPPLHLLQSVRPLPRLGGLTTALAHYDAREPLWLILPTPILRRAIRYLWERRIDAEVALPGPSPATGDAGPTAALDVALLQAPGGAAGPLCGLRGLPGVYWFAPLSDHIAVELGHAHPFRLLAFESLFPRDGRHLFIGGQTGFVSLPRAPFVPLARLVDLQFDDGDRGARSSAPPATMPRDVRMSGRASSDPTMRLPLRLTVEPTPGCAATGTLVPWSQIQILCQLTYLLPAAVLERQRALAVDDGLLIVGDVSHLPLGQMHYDAGAGVLVPMGMAVGPRLAGDLLRTQILQGKDTVGADALVWLRPGAAGDVRAHVVPRSALAPLSSQLLSHVDLALLDGKGPLAPDDDSPNLAHESLGFLWPLWGGPRLSRGQLMLSPPSGKKADQD